MDLPLGRVPLLLLLHPLHSDPRTATALPAPSRLEYGAPSATNQTAKMPKRCKIEARGLLARACAANRNAGNVIGVRKIPCVTPVASFHYRTFPGVRPTYKKRAWATCTAFSVLWPSSCLLLLRPAGFRSSCVHPQLFGSSSLSDQSNRIYKTKSICLRH